MKRYRVLSFDFDMRINVLLKLIEIHKVASNANVDNQVDDLLNDFKAYYGSRDFEIKMENLKAIGAKGFSILSYHNILIEQVREALISGNYYPALVGACTLGERILNHLVMDLCSAFSEQGQKTKLVKPSSNWNDMINHLEEWNVLLPDIVREFKILRDIRNRSIHFNSKLTENLRERAIAAVLSIQRILFTQFSAFGDQPWFITDVPGEIYIKKEWENNPFVSKYYLPNCIHVGFFHKVTGTLPFQIIDNFHYENGEIEDDEYSKLRKEGKAETIS